MAFQTHAAALVFVKNYVLKLTDEERDQLFKVLTPKFVLLDHDFNIVYDSRLQPETKYLKFGNPLSTVFIQDGRIRDQAYGYFENIPQDHVSIQLEKSLGQGLKISPNATTDLNQTFITAGFDYDSINFNFLVDQGQPHNLLDLKANSGRYMDFLLTPMTLSHEDFLKHTLIEQLMLMGYSEESSISQIEQYGDELIARSIKTVLHAHSRHERDLLIESHDNVLFLTNPVLPGQSGGPVLNTKGKVLGLITNSILEHNSEDSTYVSHGAGVYIFNSKN